MTTVCFRTHVAIAIFAGLGLFVAATPAAADTQPLFPKVECASFNKVTQKLVVSFGVDNQLSTVVTNPLNVFSPSTPGLPTTFYPGYTPATFVATFQNPGTDISWFLGQTTYPAILRAPGYHRVSYDNGQTYLPVKGCPKSFL